MSLVTLYPWAICDTSMMGPARKMPVANKQTKTNFAFMMYSVYL